MGTIQATPLSQVPLGQTLLHKGSIVVPEKSLELWALPPGQAPRSLGLVATQDKHSVRLKSSADSALGDAALLAISLEPPGGSPTGAPTGPVLYTGPCVKTW